MPEKLSHIDFEGKMKMVDVSEKHPSIRTASARGTVKLGKKVFKAVKQNTVAKGDVLAAAKLAGIQGAKNTPAIIPLCHNIFLSNVDLLFKLKNNCVEITSVVKTNAQTGVEMEALTAVCTAALTVYDMCKAMDKSIKITDIYLISKKGGKSDDFNFYKRNNAR